MSSEKPTWAEVLSDIRQTDYFKNAHAISMQARDTGKEIFPPANMVFNAFDRTEFSDVSVVIVGQDPYHSPGQAEGLAFSVPIGIPLPPSLQNIMKELRDDVGIPYPPAHGHLGHWADQGVLLLNSVLTVESGKPGSHANIGWESFTDAVVRAISDKRNHVVFILWGNYAKKKLEFIDTTKHTVLTAAHPSPLSAHNGFFGCKHFSQTNAALKKHGQDEIDWNITSTIS